MTEIPQVTKWVVSLTSSKVVSFGRELAIKFNLHLVSKKEIPLGGAEIGSLNIGARLIATKDKRILWEGRATPDRLVLDPVGEHECDVICDTSALEVKKDYVFVVGLVIEGVQWLFETPTPLNSWSFIYKGFTETPKSDLGDLNQAYLQKSLIKALGELQRKRNELAVVLRDRNRLQSRFDCSLSSTTHFVNGAEEFQECAKEISGLLDIVERRDYWLSRISEMNLPEEFYAFYPHDGEEGPLNLLVFGSGGFGDILYLTPLISALKQRFPMSRIVVAHENLSVEEVLKTNPYILRSFGAHYSDLKRLKRLASVMDVFDLVADVRYVVSFTQPPKSRIDTEFFRSASFKSAEWAPFVGEEWPRLNNSLAKRAAELEIRKLDLVGYTSNLPIDADSPLEMFFCSNEMLPFKIDGPYFTVHHGADPKMVGKESLQTKNLPLSTFKDVVRKLKERGIKVVQLGLEAEQFIDLVDVDLRGKTTFLQTALIIKQAKAHIDTEGGLVHVARAVHTKAVVAFGPTPVEFFGYHQNANLSPKICGGCWWLTESWSKDCPKGYTKVECMQSHGVDAIISAAIDLCPQTTFELEPTLVSSRPAPSASRSMASIDQIAFVIAGNGEPSESFLSRCRQASGALFVPAGRYDDLEPTLCLEMSVRAYSADAFPINSGSLASIEVSLGEAAPGEGIKLVGEIFRCLRNDGDAYFWLQGTSFQNIIGLVKRLEATGYRIAGNLKDKPIKAPPDVEASVLRVTKRLIPVVKQPIVETPEKARQKTSAV